VGYNLRIQRWRPNLRLTAGSPALYFFKVKALKIMKLSKHKLVFLMLMGIICLILPVQSQADNKPDEVKIPQSIYLGLHHFFDLVDPEKNDDWDYFYSNTQFSQ
jgi:hypothetical protein